MAVRVGLEATQLLVADGLEDEADDPQHHARDDRRAQAPDRARAATCTGSETISTSSALQPEDHHQAPGHEGGAPALAHRGVAAVLLAVAQLAHEQIGPSRSPHTAVIAEQQPAPPGSQPSPASAATSATSTKAGPHAGSTIDTSRRAMLDQPQRQHERGHRDGGIAGDRPGRGEDGGERGDHAVTC